MAFTETVTEGWGSRVGNSFKGVLFGIILFIAGFPILFLNEGRAVKTAKALKEGAAAVVSVPAESLTPANEGKLIHISGLVDTAGQVTDPEFGVNAKALKLIRKVEMFQWVEEKETTTREKAGGSKETTTTYTYTTKWSDTLESSSNFKEPEAHQNPTQMPYNPSHLIAQDAKLGAYQIPPRLIERMDSAADLPLAEGKFQTPANAAVPPKLVDGRLFFGADPAHPVVGNTRVSFSVLNPAVASIVAKQAGGTLEPYPTKAGKDVELMEMGQKDAKSMFETAVKNNIVITWVIRFLGFLAMFIGLNLLFQPLVMIAKFIPFLGSLLNVGTGLFAGVIAFVCSLITIAVAWFVFRPVFGILLLAVALAAVIGIYLMPGRIKINQPAGEPAQAPV